MLAAVGFISPEVQRGGCEVRVIPTEELFGVALTGKGPKLTIAKVANEAKIVKEERRRTGQDRKRKRVSVVGWGLVGIELPEEDCWMTA